MERDLDQYHIRYETKCEKEKVSFPPQHQDKQPGLEYIMDPQPIFDRDDYVGSGKLQDRVAIVTGGDSGIGRATAIAFVKEGAKVVIVYLDEHEDASFTKQYIECLGGECMLLSGDMKDPHFSEIIVQKTLERFHKINVLVNAVGVQYPQKSILDISNEQLDFTFRTNLFSSFYLIKAVLPHLEPYGSIINTTSVTTYIGDPGLIDYVATKGGVVGLTRSLAKNLADQKVRVNAVAPGYIWTPLIVSSFSTDIIPTFGSSAPIKRPAQPVELAPTYVYLANEDSSFVTGQILHVDGALSTNS